MSEPQPGEEKSLPKGLWIGTAVFVFLAAGALMAMMHFGKTQIEDTANREIESRPVELDEKQLQRMDE